MRSSVAKSVAHSRMNQSQANIEIARKSVASTRRRNSFDDKTITKILNSNLDNVKEALKKADEQKQGFLGEDRLRSTM